MADLCYGHICDEHSPDQSTAQQVLSFNEARDHEALDAASTSHSAFGTAGLRAAVGDGKSRMRTAPWSSALPLTRHLFRATC